MPRRLASVRSGRPGALVLVPTRELAIQVAADLEPLAAAKGLDTSTARKRIDDLLDLVNLADVRAVFRARITRQLATAPDPSLTALYEELLA